MSRRTKIVLVVVAFFALAAGSALVPERHLEAHHDGPWPTGDHWSLIGQVFPGLVSNVFGMVESHPTYVDGTAPDRVIHVFMALVVLILAVGAGWVVWRRTRKDPPLVPDEHFGVFTFMEGLAGAVLGLMEGLMGEIAAKKYFPLIASLAVFIFFSNVLGMIPGFLPPTDILDTTLALGLVVFASTHYFGVREHGLAYFKHFLGPIIAWYALPLMILMLLIETISHLVRPLSLGIRLMGNIMGDHKVLGIFLGFGVLFLPLPIMVLGAIVAVVQTMVFCLLSMVYIALAIEHAEEH
jgi:F-type H+-transporting ATPase subunit a